MIIKKQISEQLEQLNGVVNELEKEQFTKRLHYLHNASIGEHIRHIIEMYFCLFNHYDSGVIDYFNRTRDMELEHNTLLINQKMALINEKLQLKNKPLQLKVTCHLTQQIEFVETNFERELAYNLEHHIHHLAIIKIGLIELGITIKNNFLGVAYSTQKYKTT
ncbi:MAG: hypothetical protein ORN85_04985 [Sediminibacterium sp.]|nr:hypothetical protein [Sediminibacterium sp.]